MGLYHVATITPSKEELLAAWLPTRPWAPEAADGTEVIGAYRFDDPEGRVGMESFLVRAGSVVLHAPITYRDAPLAGADHALITQMQHSALGTRWVYDGLHDPCLLTMLSGATLTGQGEALGLAQHEGRWVMVPGKVRIHGGGWSTQRVPIDGFAVTSGADDAVVTLANDRFELMLQRRPVAAAPRPPIALTASWAGQDEPVLLAEVRAREVA